MTPKQEAFVREYLVDLNATQAAARAGYSERTANEQGARLLANVSVRSAIEEAQKARAERTQVDADWVLKRLHEDATADLSTLYDENGHLRPISDWPMVFRTGLVAGIETAVVNDGAGEDGKPRYVTVRKVKLADRLKMVELIGKHIGVQAFKDRIEVEDVTNRAEQMRKRRESRGGQA